MCTKFLLLFLYRYVRFKCFLSHLHKHKTTQAKDLLRGLLKNEPNERLDVKEALKHTFIYAHHIPKHLPQSSCHRPPDLTHILTRFVFIHGTPLYILISSV